ncbi:MAG: aromatic ring-hydroxylating oxygenase subunit alpha [Candidatus Puniceispirillales bacterium WSBS_2018_MAG_OTU23]
MQSIQDTLKPITTAKGLPSHLYIDDSASAAERERVFFNNWTALTNAKNIPDAGSVMPVDLLEMPLFALRGHDGTVKVFQNVCRHRGMRLVDAAGKVKGPITCPYHAWAYDLDGKLKSTPHVGGANIHHHDNINPEEMGLLEVRSHVWRDVIFVNINENCAPFEDVHQELITRWGEFEQPIFHGGDDSSFRLTLNSNWKLAVDNYCESYHLPFVHPGLNSYSRLEDHYNIIGEGAFAGQGTLVYNPSFTQDAHSFPNFKNLSSKWDKAAEYVALFPNLLLGIHRDHAYSIVIEPKAHGQMVEHVEIYYPTEACLGDDYKDLRTKNTSLWKSIFEEDIGVVEGMYEGRKAHGYDGGKFSPIMEGATHKFHYWIAEQMLDTVE